MEKFKELKKIISSIDSDVEKFYASNNNAAGTRVRKSMLEIKNLSQEIRKEVTELKEKFKGEAKK